MPHHSHPRMTCESLQLPDEKLRHRETRKDGTPETRLTADQTLQQETQHSFIHSFIHQTFSEQRLDWRRRWTSKTPLIMWGGGSTFARGPPREASSLDFGGDLGRASWRKWSLSQVLRISGSRPGGRVLQPEETHVQGLEAKRQ